MKISIFWFVVLFIFLGSVDIFWAEQRELTLLDFVSPVYYSSKYLRFKRERLKLQKASIISSYRKLFPSLSITYGKNQRVIKYGADTTEYSLGFNISQVLFDSGEQLLNIENENFQNSISEIELKQQESAFILSLTSFYLSDFLLKREQLNIKNEFLSVQRKEMMIAKKRLEIKEATPLDVYEWEIAVKQLEIEIKDLTDEYEDVLDEIRYQLGLEESDNIYSKERLTDNVSNVISEIEPIISRDIEEDFYAAVLASSDLKKLEVNNKYLSFLRKKLEYSVFPTVELTFGTSTVGERLLSSRIDWMVGLNISFPLFFNSNKTMVGLSGDKNNTYKTLSAGNELSVYDNPTYFLDVKSVNLQIMELENQKEDLLRKLKQKIRSYHRKLASYRDVLLEVSNEVDLLEKKLAIQSVKFKLGEEKATDYIKSLLDFQNAKIKRASTIVEIVKLIYEYKFVVGELTTLEDIENLYKKLIFRE
jgi:outer membrane protein TolC